MTVAQRVHHEYLPNHALEGLAGFKAALTNSEPAPADSTTPPVVAENASSAPTSAVEALHVVPQVDTATPAPASPSPVSEEARQTKPRPRTQKPSYPAHSGSRMVDMPTKQPVRAPQQFEDMSLRCLRFVDLCTRVAMQKESGITCRFILRDGNSYAVFTLSVVPTNRVRFTCRESTVSFAPIFAVGSELFQDEIYKILNREPSPERQMATGVFQEVLEAIDKRMSERRNERNQGSQGRSQARPTSNR